jgi:hypothetical protein
MRPRRPLAAAAVAALLAVPACVAADDRALPPLDAAAVPAVPAPMERPAQLCDAIPGEVVAEATGRAVTVDGAGTQCSWRADAPGDDGRDIVLQGSFIDARSFEVGRRDVGAAAVAGLGDDAYLVHPGDLTPPTLYVLDGSRAFALWLGDPAAAGAEGALTRLARQVLAS